ncbi:MAG: hypothetical protein JSU86_08285 [Phycisphaerales bacterium]|nr:MAG: hypothetical protein JSU86_08285 [Phycisphaerales bacterium]
MNHKYAVLAVIHDALSDGRPINPWRGSKRSIAHLTSGALWFVGLIRVHVPKIADDDRERIEGMVAVVRNDLLSKGLLGDADADAAGTADVSSPVTRELERDGHPPKGEEGIDLWLEETIPLLNTSDSDKWITSIAAARLRNVANSALRQERSKTRARFRHSQSTCGIDGKGQWWRKEPGKQDVWYYLPSLSDHFKHRDAQPVQLLRATQNKS